MKKNIFTNNIYLKNYKNIYCFENLIISEKFNHLITDFFYIKNDIRKSINLYYNTSTFLKKDTNPFLDKEYSFIELLLILQSKKLIDDLYNKYFEDYDLKIENDNWFEINLKTCFVYAILFHYKLLNKIDVKKICYIKDNIKLFNLVNKIINKNYNLELYFTYLFEKFDYLKDIKKSYKTYNENILSNNIIIYFKIKKTEKLDNLFFIKNILIQNNSKYCDTFENLFFFKTDKYYFKDNNFLIYDIEFFNLLNLDIELFFIEKDSIFNIENNDDNDLYFNINNIKITLINKNFIYPLYLYNDFIDLMKKKYKELI